ncbi:MAG: hypothetical protein U0168_20200 [Nannocystaceae bacterium]
MPSTAASAASAIERLGALATRRLLEPPERRAGVVDFGGLPAQPCVVDGVELLAQRRGLLRRALGRGRLRGTLADLLAPLAMQLRGRGSQRRLLRPAIGRAFAQQLDTLALLLRQRIVGRGLAGLLLISPAHARDLVELAARLFERAVDLTALEHRLQPLILGQLFEDLERVGVHELAPISSRSCARIFSTAAARSLRRRCSSCSICGRTL